MAFLPLTADTTLFTADTTLITADATQYASGQLVGDPYWEDHADMSVELRQLDAAEIEADDEEVLAAATLLIAHVMRSRIGATR